MNSELPFLVGDVYLAQKKLSQGSFGTVYSGVELKTKEILAIKIESKENNPKSYNVKEANILQRLQSVKGIPKLIWFNDNSIVLSLLGKDLSSYLKIFKKFSQKTVAMVTCQILTILENIHNRGVLHRDLKPENIVVGRGEDCKQIYLIDYGISKMAEKLSEIKYKENKSFVGTARYASVAAHKGHELSRKDDIESLFYVMIFCAKGFLPWQKINASEEEKIFRVGKIKEELTDEEICQGMPMGFIEAFSHIRKLSYGDDIDYEFLRDLIIKFSEEEDFEMDNLFDWISPFNLENKKSTKKKRVKVQTVVDMVQEPEKSNKSSNKIHKTNTNAVEEKDANSGSNGVLEENKQGYLSQNSLTTVPVNGLNEKDRKFRQSNTSRFQKVANELLTIPGSESFQISENSINMSSRCSSMQIKYEPSEDSYGILILMILN